MTTCTCQAIESNSHLPECPASAQSLQAATDLPLITVVIPCYNHGKYLKEAVESIMGQTYHNLEIIIVNDGSKDETVEVAEALVRKDSRIKFIDFLENKGKWACLNFAIEKSQGLFITSQDADDLALPQRIERQFKAMQATESVHNLCGFYHCYTEEDVQKHKNEYLSDELKGIEADAVSQMVDYGFQTPGINHYFTAEFETAGTSAMFLKALWNVGFRFNPPGVGLRITNSEDSDFNLRVTLALRNTTVLAEPLYLYRRGTGTNNENR